MVKVTSKPAGKQKVDGGSGHMQGFKAVGAQAPGGTAVKMSGGGKSPGAKITGGPSGKVGKQVGVQKQKPGITSTR